MPEHVGDKFVNQIYPLLTEDGTWFRKTDSDARVAERFRLTRMKSRSPEPALDVWSNHGSSSVPILLFSYLKYNILDTYKE